jgi:hypothetical protein
MHAGRFSLALSRLPIRSLLSPGLAVMIAMWMAARPGTGTTSSFCRLATMC